MIRRCCRSTQQSALSIQQNLSAGEEGGVKDFRDLKVWEKSHKLALLVYKHMQPFPRQEMFGLTSQARRAAVSIPTNIAGGCGRGGNFELARFLSIAMGSASELEYLLLISNALGFLNRIDHKELELATSEVKRMLAGLIAKINTEHRKA
jgi:four helix bundle protein